MPKTQPGRNRSKSSRHRAKLKAKHTKQRMRAAGQLRKRRGARRLTR